LYHAPSGASGSDSRADGLPTAPQFQLVKIFNRDLPFRQSVKKMIP
jgi:hypothetical protein